MIIYGTGGHAFVVYEALSSCNIHVNGLFDDSVKAIGFENLNVSPYERHVWSKDEVVVAIGDNTIRKTIAQKLKHSIGTSIHNEAFLSPSAKIDTGSVVLVKAVVNSRSSVGKHVIINTSSVVDHDCHIEDYVHVAPHATLCGHVKVGEGTLIGAGAKLLPSVEIGEWSQIDAGVVISQNVSAFTRVKRDGTKISLK